VRKTYFIRQTGVIFTSKFLKRYQASFERINMTKNYHFSNLFFLFILHILLLGGLSACQSEKKSEYTKVMGLAQGTTYHLTYLSEENLKLDVDSLLAEFDTSLSTYNSASLITAINENRDVDADSFLLTVLRRSQQICEATEGAFDITIGPIANYWGFGFRNRDSISPEGVEELLKLVGCYNFSIVGTKIQKSDSAVLLNVNAIAQGYAVDVVSSYLESRGIMDYMVEIGGELKVKGKNPHGEKWQVGINRPVDDSTNMNNEIQEVLAISDLSLATSGNYRKFYVEGGIKYSHTLDPSTGHPVKHNLLSATVITPTCMDADAYATAFMVMGMERSLVFLDKHPEIQGYLISSREDGTYEIKYSDGLKKFFRTKDEN
jgi:FAD:protein FMN transferase